MKIRATYKPFVIAAILLLASCSDDGLPAPTASNSLTGELNIGFWAGPGTFNLSFSYPKWTTATALTLNSTSYNDQLRETKITGTHKVPLDAPVTLFDADLSYDDVDYTITDGIGKIRKFSYTSTFQTDTASLPTSRYGHQVVGMTNSETSVTTFYMIGGTDGNAMLNDVWKSMDGINWTPLTLNAPFAPRFLHRVVVMNDPGNQDKPTMWLIGGTDGTNAYNDIYKSVDGATWEEVEVEGTTFSSRYIFSLASMKDPATGSPAIFLIGGRSTAGVRYNEVWKSANGSNWTKVTTTGSIFSGRTAHQSIVAKDPSTGKDAIWITGGYDGSHALGDVWKSTDGVAWTRTTAAGTFGTRYHHQLVVLKSGLLCLIAGVNDSYLYNDAWTSADGVTWSQLSDSGGGARFGSRYLHQAVVGTLGTTPTTWIFGGQKSNGTAFSDAWKTTDGHAFVQGYGATVVF
ncbi:MAG: hypothetical protein WDO14_14225 [Bacteroidota bacterium]